MIRIGTGEKEQQDSLKQLYEAVNDPATYDHFPGRDGLRMDYHELLEHYSMEHIYNGEHDKGVKNLLEDIADGEGFRYRKTADLYINLSMKDNDPHRVRSVLRSMEQLGVRGRLIREFRPLLENSLEDCFE